MKIWSVAKLRTYYEQEYGPRALHKDRARVNRLAFVFPADMSGKQVLDIGCGPGVQFLAHLPRNEFHGVDISSIALAESERNGLIPHQLSLGDDPLPFPDRYFDAVVCTDVFEHLFDPLAALTEARRVLKDDGVLIASVPNHFLWWMLIRLALNKGLVLPFHHGEDWNYFHLRFFTSRSFDRFLEAGGMRVIRHRYEAFPSFHWFVPRFIRPWLIQRFPDKFTFHFLVEAVKA